MSEARNAIFEALRAARPPRATAERRTEFPGMPENPLRVLGDRVQLAGGRIQHVSRTALREEIEWPAPLETLEHVYSTVPAIEGRGVGLERRSHQDLEPLSLCVLEAELAVVENGAAWHVPDSSLTRSAALLAEHLTVLVDETNLVATLHHAYERIDLSGLAFGWFLCGPSKTADIEQSLVLGAHGPRSMHLVVLGA